jgi:hypothetical protein
MDVPISIASRHYGMNTGRFDASVAVLSGDEKKFV